jgi:hypothetical protein
VIPIATILVARAGIAQLELLPCVAVSRFDLAAISPAAGLARLNDEPGVCTFWSWKNFVIGTWRQPATELSVQHLVDAMERILPTYPSGISGFHVVHEGTAPPTPGARKLLLGAMERYADNVAGLGVVLMGGGFWASAVHAAITGVRMLSRQSVKMRIDTAVSPAARWLCPLHTEKTSTRIEPDDLRRAAEMAFAHFIGETDPAAPSGRQEKI